MNGDEMKYIPKQKESKATKAIYIRTRMIEAVDAISIKTGLSFSEIVDQMIETCIDTMDEEQGKDAAKNNK